MNKKLLLSIMALSLLVTAIALGPVLAAGPDGVKTPPASNEARTIDPNRGMNTNPAEMQTTTAPVKSANPASSANRVPGTPMANPPSTGMSGSASTPMGR